MQQTETRLEDFIAALSVATDICDQHSRARAYLEAGLNLKGMTLEDIRVADQVALETELNRRISRS